MSTEPVILVTDDQPHMRKLVQFNLAPLGRPIETAGSGPETLELAATLPVALLVIDVVMDGMDGFETVRELRRIERYRELPVIMLTSRGQADIRDEAATVGVDVFLTKPFSPAELQATARRLLGD